jgi:hypothetical protein
LEETALYFQLGWQHILDFQGYDHILFVLVLCGPYLLKDWKKVLLLATAFTVGHSLTLALSVTNLISPASRWIEFLIPVTILATAIFNITRGKNPRNTVKPLYGLATGFGLIHGMGFSAYLKSLLGRDNSVIRQLFAFNIGLEAGQIVIVATVLALSFLVINLLRAKHRDWNLFISSAAFGIAFIMAAERIGNI